MKKIDWAIWIFILLLGGCNLFQDPGKTRNTLIAGENYSIRLNLNGLDEEQNQRTLLPQWPSSLEYKLSFSGPENIDSLTLTQTDPVVELTSGSWDITAIACDGINGLPLASGNASIQVPDENTLDISLSTDSRDSSTGALALTLAYSLPQGIVIDTVTVELSLYGGSQSYDLCPENALSPLQISSEGLPCGDYLFIVHFYDTLGNELTPYSEMLQIRGNLTTSAHLILENRHFTSLPETPADLRLNDTSSGVVINWVDMASTESGFMIERKEENGTFSTLVELEGYNITQYTDDTAVDGHTYTYRILACNSFGNSNVSEEETITVSTEAAVLYVIEGGNGTLSGLSWSDAMGDPQQAIELASSFTRKPEIWVAQGSYQPQSDIHGTGELHFSLQPEIKLFGGFSGIESNRQERDISNNPTILSGDLDQDDLISGFGSTLTINNSSDNVSQVFYHPQSLELDSQAAIDGFTISGGHGSNHGAGIYNGSGCPQISNCIFIGNRGSQGGAVYCENSIVNISNCVFDRNYATYGGAICLRSCSGTIRNSVINGNYASYTGGIRFIDCDSMDLVNTTVCSNHSSNDYGTIYINNSPVDICNSVISANTAPEIHSLYYSNPTGEEGIFHSIIQDYESGVKNPLPQDQISALFILDPGFNHLDLPWGIDGIWMTADDGLNPASDSAMIDSGKEAFLTGTDPQTGFYPPDIKGEDRLQGNHVDLGAYESPFTDLSSPNKVSGLTTVNQGSGLLVRWTDPEDSDYTAAQITWTPIEGLSQPLTINRGIESAQLTGLNEGTSYTLTLKTLDAAGNLSEGTQITATPQYIAPRAVESPQYTALYDRVHIQWTEPSDYPFDYVNLNLSDQDGTEQTQQIPAGRGSVSMAGLVPGSSFSLSLSTTTFAGEESAVVTEEFATMAPLTDYAAFNFESTAVPESWVGDWSIDNNNASSGSSSLTSGSATEDVSSTVGIYVQTAEDSILIFDYSLSNHSGSLELYIDDSLIESWSGFQEWDSFEYTIHTGIHKIEWSYYKNGESDCAWLDNIHFYSQSASIINLSLDDLTDKTLTFSLSDGYQVESEGILEVSINDIFDSYAWFLDGIELGETGPALSYNCASISWGSHVLMCVVKSEEHYYSKSLEFLVVN